MGVSAVMTALEGAKPGGKASKRSSYAWRRIKALAFLIYGISFLSFAAGATAQQRKIDIRGKITALYADRTGTGTVLIAGTDRAETSNDKASVRVTARTRIVNSTGEKISFASLRTGQPVEASFTGPVAESYPVQAVAATIRVVRSQR